MENDGGAALYTQVRKIPATTTEETLTRVLETLWGTRNTGLSPRQKTALHSLLNLPSLQELDPVLACLRSIIRKAVRQNPSENNIQELLPLDLPTELRSILLALLQRYQDAWKEEASGDQPLWQHTRVSHQTKVNIPAAFAPSPTSEMSSSMWPREDDNNNGPKPGGDPNLLSMASMPLRRDSCPLNNPMILPCLKTMTWTMENQNLAPANRVAIICLKLQEYTKSPLGEVEVKFQLSRDTLEAMLRSMTYISEQLSNSVSSASEPSAKKQRQR